MITKGSPNWQQKKIIITWANYAYTVYTATLWVCTHSSEVGKLYNTVHGELEGQHYQLLFRLNPGHPQYR